MPTEQPKNASKFTSRYPKSAMREQAAGLAPRAYSLPQFCTVYGISRSKAYQEIGAKRLPIRKIGRAVLIAVEDAEAWFASFARRREPMAGNAHGRARNPAAAVFSGSETAAAYSATAAEKQARSATLIELHVTLLREQLEKGPIPLRLTGYDRCRWAARGLTLKQREAAAALLVRWGEAEYRALPEQRFSPIQSVVHLVALPAQGGAA